MVLDDAESVARGARRRAVLRARHRQAAGTAGGVLLGLAAVALLLGADPWVTAGVVVVLAAAAVVGWLRLRRRLADQRRRAARARPGPGVGAPRPRGAFSHTRTH